MKTHGNERLQRMIRDLGRTLADALADSAKATEALRQLQEAGFTVSLELGSLEPDDHDDHPETFALSLERRGEVPVPGDPRSRPESPPEFLMQGRDLAFLRSIGIDPTRRARRSSRRRER